MTPDEAAAPVVELVLVTLQSTGAPVFLALDGRSGAGKSTLAAHLRQRLADHEIVAVVIEGDQFYAGGSSEAWDGRSAEDKVANAMDWRRQHQLLSDLREHGRASWSSFDWEAPDWDTEPAPLADEHESLALDGVNVVLLEGAYAARPELHDLLDLVILLDPPADVRREQLLGREGDAYRADWEGRWSEAEDLYFGRIMTPDKFDLVID